MSETRDGVGYLSMEQMKIITNLLYFVYKQKSE